MHSMTTQFETRWMTSLRWLPMIAAVIQVSVGGLVLWGWGFQIPLLQSLLPELATMKPLTAVANILAGIALWHLRSETSPIRQKTLGRLCAGLVMLIGGVVLAEYLFHLPWNIDAWLFAEAILAEGGPYPGRPSPATALCLFLLGLALLMLDWRANWPTSLLALAVLFISGLALIGYIYGVESLYQIPSYSSTALHTVALFIIGVIGGLFARPTQAVMAVIHSRFGGGQMARRLLPAALLLPLVLGWFHLQGELVGWYDTHFGLALFASGNIVMFSILIFLNARQLNQEDAQRAAILDSLRASENRFAKIFNSSPTAISISSTETGRIIEINEAGLQLFGYSRAEVIGRTAIELGITNPQLRQQAIEEIKRVGVMRNREGVVYTRTGEARHVIISIETDTLNNELCTLASMFDITERKRAEEAQRLSAAIMENIAAGIDLVRVSDGAIVYTNPGFDKLFGYAQGELIGQSVSVINAPTEHTPEETAHRIFTALRQDKVWEGEVYSRHKDGTAFWCYASVSTFEHTEHGTVWVEARQDISERKRAEALLHRQARLLELAHEPIVIWQLDGGIVFWNRGAEQLYGFSADEALGRESHALLSTKHPLGINQFLALLKQTGEWQGELTHTRHDGTQLIVESRQQLIHDEMGVWLVLETNRDVTERKRAEAKITEALREKEVLLKEIHHRVKNNLQVIASMLRLQADGLPDPNARALLMDNQRRVRSMALIHEQLYQAQDLAHINFSDYVTSLVNYLWRLYAPTQALAEVQVHVEAITLEIEQAMPLGLIVNELVSNSLRHAFPAGAAAGPRRLWVSARRATSGWLEVEVGDTGVGLPEGFAIEKTTSMGLQLVQAFILQLRGQLQIHNHPGARFTMTFPQL